MGTASHAPRYLHLGGCQKRQSTTRFTTYKPRPLGGRQNKFWSGNPDTYLSSRQTSAVYLNLRPTHSRSLTSTPTRQREASCKHATSTSYKRTAQLRNAKRFICPFYLPMFCSACVLLMSMRPSWKTTRRSIKSEPFLLIQRKTTCRPRVLGRQEEM
jgi:hypothetical protein